MLRLLPLSCLFALISAATSGSDQSLISHHGIPPPPQPEPISIIELPLPPISNGTSPGACTKNVNPNGTGCVGKAIGSTLQVGSFLPDGNHVLASIQFVGAGNESSSSSYNGQQVIIVKADGTTFTNGDSWKCITCGIPAAQNHTIPVASPDYGYPQAFDDGKKVMAGFYIIDCGDHNLTSPDCTPHVISIYTIRLDSNKNGTGSGLALRELRIHPDQEHISFNSFTYSGSSLGQSTFVGKLSFNAAPTTGLPLAPRYDLANVQQLSNPNLPPPLSVKGSELHINQSAITVGEIRGFSGTGKEVTYIGYSVESCNIDIFAADLYTGNVRRLTTHPGYVDPVRFSADDGSIIIMDTRGSGRTEFMDGMRGVPPITDILTTSVCSSVRNNGARRFFQPWLLDGYGDRGDYYGQELNNASYGKAGTSAIDDPEWNGGADPWFSPDGTKIVYYQVQTVSPACGDSNPLPCYDSTEPGGRTGRIMLATLTSRKPIEHRKLSPVPETIPWATTYIPGSSSGSLVNPSLPNGNYTLKGECSGSAAISVQDKTIAVSYTNFSSDGLGLIHGTQQISSRVERFTVNYLDWYSNLTRTGLWPATQVTSGGGFHMSIDVLTNIFEANGTLTTTTDGIFYRQPLNGA